MVADEQLQARVLLVEDCPDDQRLMAFVLTGAGADVVLECNGEAAVRRFERSHVNNAGIDGVVMDLQMPGIDGMEATRRLRHCGYDGPIIAVSAHGDPQPEDKWLSAGCTCYVKKPFHPAEFLQVVDGAVSKRAGT